MTSQEALALARAKWGDNVRVRVIETRPNWARYSRQTTDYPRYEIKRQMDEVFSQSWEGDSWESACFAAGLIPTQPHTEE